MRIVNRVRIIKTGEIPVFSGKIGIRIFAYDKNNIAMSRFRGSIPARTLQVEASNVDEVYDIVLKALEKEIVNES